MKDTLTQALLDKDFHSIKTNIMKVVENKLREKIDAKKEDVLKMINGK